MTRRSPALALPVIAVLAWGATETRGEQRRVVTGIPGKTGLVYTLRQPEQTVRLRTPRLSRVP